MIHAIPGSMKIGKMVRVPRDAFDAWVEARAERERPTRTQAAGTSAAEFYGLDSLPSRRRGTSR